MHFTAENMPRVILCFLDSVVVKTPEDDGLDDIGVLFVVVKLGNNILNGVVENFENVFSHRCRLVVAYRLVDRPHFLVRANLSIFQFLRIRLQLGKLFLELIVRPNFHG